MNKFIVLEGIDGTGKTALSKELARISNSRWVNEPSDHSKLTTQLRAFCLNKEFDEEVGDSREYLLMANRAVSLKHVAKLLKSGDVISDRSFVSGLVFARVASRWSFGTWLHVAQPILQSRPLPNVIVQIHNDDQKFDEAKAANDIYDLKDQSFHLKIEETFKDAFALLKSNFQFIEVLHYNNSFLNSVEENALNLREMLLEKGLMK